jgi:hypothetical protein
MARSVGSRAPAPGWNPTRSAFKYLSFRGYPRSNGVTIGAARDPTQSGVFVFFIITLSRVAVASQACRFSPCGPRPSYNRRCCASLTSEDSFRGSMRLDALDERAASRPLSHHGLVRLQRVAAQAGIAADPGRQWHGLARAAGRSARTPGGVFRCGHPVRPVDQGSVQSSVAPA